MANFTNKTIISAPDAKAGLEALLTEYKQDLLELEKETLDRIKMLLKNEEKRKENLILGGLKKQ